MLITAFLGNKAQFKPHETVIILDEIQSCPEARTALKFLNWTDVMMSLLPVRYWA